MASSPFANLISRHRRQELMDQPGLDFEEHVRALRGLGRINALSRSDALLWPAIVRLARGPSREPVRVLDIASGGGDVPIALAWRAARSRLKVQIDGCDLSPQAVQFARRQADARGVAARFFPLDALRDPLPTEYDVVCCSLFLHHLDTEEAITLLRRMAAAARRLVLVNDLIRSRWGYVLARVCCRLLTRSRIVHVDGPLSVAAAFTPDEALGLAARAGLVHATVTRHWPQRFLLTWSRP